MTLEAFVERYYLHDSELTELKYDPTSATADAVIDFCYWMQDWYVEGEQPENGFIKVKFVGVSSLKYDRAKGNGTFGNSIHGVELTSSGALIFKQSDEDTFEYYETMIAAESVEVEPLPNRVEPSFDD